MDDRITQDTVQPAQPETPAQPEAPVQPFSQPATATPEPTQPNTVAPAVSMDTIDEAPALPQEPMQPTTGDSLLNPVAPTQAQVASTQEAYKDGDLDSKKHKMKEVLAGQPKVLILVPLKDGEDKDAWQYVGINGYPIWVKKGVYVEVPRQVADILNESNNLTYAVGQEHLSSAKADRQEALR